MTDTKLYEGDRFKVDDAYDYYQLTCSLPHVTPGPVFGVLDEEDGGYIAFTTDESQADKIADALNRNTTLCVSFEPAAIRGHYELDAGYYDPEDDKRAEWVAQASDEQLVAIGYGAVGSDTIWEEFNRLLRELIDEERGYEETEA